MKRFLAVFLILCTLVMLVACDTDKQQEAAESEPKITNIFLSKSEVTLGIDETINLIATVSPSNIQTTLTWSSSDDTIAEVDSHGTVTAVSVGAAVIKVETPNGVVAVCNVEVKIKTGSVSGTVTYKYNNYVGNKSDTDSNVFLVSKNVTSLPDGMAFGDGLTSFNAAKKCDGVYATRVDGNGHYILDNIPVGDYYITIVSKNTTGPIAAGLLVWGNLYKLFSENGKKYADMVYNNSKCGTITVLDGQAITFSYDFGVSYY